MADSRNTLSGETVVFDSDKTLTSRHLHDFSNFFIAAVLDPKTSQARLTNDQQKVFNSYLETIDSNLKELIRNFDNELSAWQIKNAEEDGVPDIWTIDFREKYAAVVDKIWGAIKVVEFDKPTGDAAVWKENLTSLVNAGANVGFASASGFKPIIEKFLQEKIELDEEVFKKIHIEAFTPKDGEQKGNKIQHMEKIFNHFGVKNDADKYPKLWYVEDNDDQINHIRNKTPTPEKQILHVPSTRAEGGKDNANAVQKFIADMKNVIANRINSTKAKKHENKKEENKNESQPATKVSTEIESPLKKNFVLYRGNPHKAQETMTDLARRNSKDNAKRTSLNTRLGDINYVYTQLNVENKKWVNVFGPLKSNVADLVSQNTSVLKNLANEVKAQRSFEKQVEKLESYYQSFANQWELSKAGKNEKYDKNYLNFLNDKKELNDHHAARLIAQTLKEIYEVEPNLKEKAEANVHLKHLAEGKLEKKYELGPLFETSPAKTVPKASPVSTEKKPDKEEAVELPRYKNI